MKKLIGGLMLCGLLIGGISYNATAENTEPEVVAKKVHIDTEASTVEWYAYKVTGKHDGTVNLNKGTLEMKDGQITGGEFEIDMTSIKVLDGGSAGGYAGKLEGHLNSDDFFSTANFPTANLVITNAKSTGKNTFEITADLTIKGATHPVTFNATTNDENGKLVAKAEIKVDRSKYDVRYGSETFFGDLGDKAIYDEFDLKIKLVSK